ncbi:hypothetical protein SAMN05519105_2661 [Rhodobacter sp. 24-YEA-8]|nr:hypothetical protein SAMN05519105_2661 [Rhodobacter sp. 24-YEA-8]
MACFGPDGEEADSNSGIDLVDSDASAAVLRKSPHLNRVQLAGDNSFCLRNHPELPPQHDLPGHLEFCRDILTGGNEREANRG